MVFFTCNACGESLKKAQIQKHSGMCRGARVFSCIDCGTDFRGDEYKNHVKCISEDQKYGGKNYEAKANKGDVKQQQWIQRIQEAINKPGVNARLKSVLQHVVTYDNVPRKKAKFQNWMKNSLKIHDSSLQTQVWDIFSTSTDNETNGVHDANKAVAAENNTPSTDDPEEEDNSNKKKNDKSDRKENQKKGKKKKTENGNLENEQNGESSVTEQGKKKKGKRKAEEVEDAVKENTNHTKKKKKKKMMEEEESEVSPNTNLVEDQQEEEDIPNSKGKFNWKGTIKAVLRQAPEEELSVKKLRKKVLAAYLSFSGEENYKSEEELYSLFNKKLKNPKFRMVKDKVRLIK